MKNVFCECGGIIYSLNGGQSYRCEKCEKEYKFYDLKYDFLTMNKMTGWIFPMKWDVLRSVGE